MLASAAMRLVGNQGYEGSAQAAGGRAGGAAVCCC